MNSIQYKVIKAFPIMMFVIINIILITLVSILGYYYFTNNRQTNNQNLSKPSLTTTPSENVIIDNDLVDELFRENSTQTDTPTPTSTTSPSPTQSPSSGPSPTVTNTTITSTPQRQTQSPTSIPTTTQRIPNTTITNTPSTNPFSVSDFVSIYDDYTGIEISRIKYWKEDYEGLVDLPAFYKRFVDENGKIVAEYELLPYANNTVPTPTQLLSQYTILNRPTKQYISQDEYVIIEIRFYPNEFVNNNTVTRLKFYYLDNNEKVRKFANETEKQYLIQLSNAISNSVKYTTITTITLNNKYTFYFPIYKNFSINGNSNRIIVYEKDNLSVPKLTIKPYLDDFISTCYDLKNVDGVDYNSNFEIIVKEGSLKNTEGCSSATKSVIIFEIKNHLYITIFSTDSNYGYMGAVGDGNILLVDYVLDSLKIL
ncbi:MAG: hypothetical protein N3A71_01600 [Candidatus Dojkabacteria bacterium]|nr:hypothetical protein [Candidatus Dojkabacteria bacterium]